MRPTDRISLRNVFRVALPGIRRFWLLMLGVLALNWGLDEATAVLLPGPVGPATGPTLSAFARTVVGDLLTGVSGAAIMLLALIAGRSDRLDARFFRRLAFAVPTILLAELVISPPGWLAEYVLTPIINRFQDPGLLVTSGGMLLWTSFLMIVTVWFGVTVPAALDRGLRPLRAVAHSFRLAAGQRWRVFWLIILLGILDGLLVGLSVIPSELLGWGQEMAPDAVTYLITGVDAVVLAALYLELARVKGPGAGQVATTLD